MPGFSPPVGRLRLALVCPSFGSVKRLGRAAAGGRGSGKVTGHVYFEKRRVLKAGRRTPVDLGAWNNGRGPRAFVCWFRGAPRQ